MQNCVIDTGWRQTLLNGNQHEDTDKEGCRRVPKGAENYTFRDIAESESAGGLLMVLKGTLLEVAHVEWWH